MEEYQNIKKGDSKNKRKKMKEKKNRRTARKRTFIDFRLVNLIYR